MYDMSDSPITFTFDDEARKRIDDRVGDLSKYSGAATDLLLLIFLVVVFGLEIQFVKAIYWFLWYPVVRWYVIPRMQRYYGRRFVTSVTFEPGTGTFHFERLHGEPVHAAVGDVTVRVVRAMGSYRKPIRRVVFHVRRFEDQVLLAPRYADNTKVAAFLEELLLRGVGLRKRPAELCDPDEEVFVRGT